MVPSQLDPTKRIHLSDSDVKPVDSLVNICFNALKPIHTQIPLHNLSKDLQEKIVVRLCLNVDSLSKLEGFNDEYMKQMFGNSVEEKDYNWIHATELGWQHACSKLQSTPLDVQKAHRTDPIRPYRRLYKILKTREDEKKELLERKLREVRQLETNSKNKTMQVNVNSIQKKRGSKNSSLKSLSSSSSSSLMSSLGKRKRPEAELSFVSAKSLKRNNSTSIHHSLRTNTTSTTHSVHASSFSSTSSSPRQNMSNSTISSQSRSKIQQSTSSSGRNLHTSKSTNQHNLEKQNSSMKQITRHPPLVSPFAPPSQRRERINLLVDKPGQMNTLRQEASPPINSSSLGHQKAKPALMKPMKQPVKREPSSDNNTKKMTQLKAIGKIPKKR